MSVKALSLTVVAATCLGCGMSDQEIKDKTGDAAVSVKHAAESAGEAVRKAADNTGDTVKKAAEDAKAKLKPAFDDAAAKGRAAIKDAGAKLSDEAIKAKVLAGFNLLSGLQHDNVKVDVRGGTVYLSGTVPTMMDKMKCEGVAFGVTGDREKYVSEIVVK